MVEKKLYEGMFLVDSAKAASDWDGINSAINKILDRVNAEVVTMRKWDDRKLAYDIRGVSRGTYILCYFRADGGQIQEIEKAVQLSEKIIRALILKTDQMTQEDIDKETPATKAEKEKEKAVAGQTQQTEEDRHDDQEDAPESEDDIITEEARPVDGVEEADESEETEEIEEAGQAEEPQDSEPKVKSDD